MTIRGALTDLTGFEDVIEYIDSEEQNGEV